ncbi:MAG: L-serine ammonia-lyase, iron-sulfur-dependent, subunit alpha [Bacteroidales bacterium]|nr:L-serine ammonia-lyase, iron-sulfur-dependent, subunit alpha [Bacteroidales bacterium]
MSNFQAYLDLLKSEVVPALGCTEPIAVALAVARAREVLGEKPQVIELLLSANILKNAMGVGIPGTGITGLPIAAALGAVFGKSSDCLEVLKGLDEEAIAAAKAMVAENRVKIALKKDVEKLYIEAICRGLNGNISKAIITTKHANISCVELNDVVLECSADQAVDEVNNLEKIAQQRLPLSVDAIFAFATEVPYAQIAFIHETVAYNKAIADEGLSKGYGLMVGRKLKGFIDRGILSDDMMNNAMSITAAACDARMAGSILPVMSNSGSGNQGITATMPVYSVAKKINADEVQLARALVLSHLTAIHIKRYLGRLSALCGVVVAGIGAACGVVYLLGGKKKEMIYTIKNMIANITGMACDGAKEGCALKVSTGVAAAIQSALLAMDGSVVSANDGIIEEDIEQTIKNLGQIGSLGMMQTDEMLLQIMVSKK